MNILIAEVRAGKREGSVISTKTFDATAQIDQDTWEALRRDLEDVGISRDVITEKRHFIIAWFQEAVAAGKLEEDPPSDDENMAVLESGSDGAVDESANDNIHQKDIASMMIEPTTTEEDTSKIPVPKVQNSLERASETTNQRRNQPRTPAKVEPSRGDRKFRIRISFLFYKLGWKGKQLLEAAIAGNVAGVIDALGKGVNVDYQDNDKRTALALATGNGNEQVVRLLLENGANLELQDSRGDTALNVAAFLGHISITQLLLENGADTDSANIYGNTSLIIAASQGNKSVVRLLLRNRANLESASPINGTALMCAARLGHDSVVRLLLENGAHTDSASLSNGTALMGAARGGHDSVVRLLLEKGANVHATDVSGHTALYYAKDTVSVIQLLKSAGA